MIDIPLFCAVLGFLGLLAWMFWKMDRELQEMVAHREK
jgi:hypothetical protein